jgi:hypothetical protein
MLPHRITIPTGPFSEQALSGPIYARFWREWAELASRTGGICSAAVTGGRVNAFVPIPDGLVSRTRWEILIFR